MLKLGDTDTIFIQILFSSTNVCFSIFSQLFEVLKTVFVRYMLGKLENSDERIRKD